MSETLSLSWGSGPYRLQQGAWPPAGSKPVGSWSFFSCEFWALMELENNLKLRSGIIGLQKVGVEQSPRPRD